MLMSGWGLLAPRLTMEKSRQDERALTLWSYVPSTPEGRGLKVKVSLRNQSAHRTKPSHPAPPKG